MNVLAVFLSMNFFLPYVIREEEGWTYHEKNETTILGGIFGVCAWDERCTQKTTGLKQEGIEHLKDSTDYSCKQIAWRLSSFCEL